MEKMPQLQTIHKQNWRVQSYNLSMQSLILLCVPRRLERRPLPLHWRARIARTIEGLYVSNSSDFRNRPDYKSPSLYCCSISYGYRFLGYFICIGGLGSTFCVFQIEKLHMLDSSYLSTICYGWRGYWINDIRFSNDIQASHCQTIFCVL